MNKGGSVKKLLQIVFIRHVKQGVWGCNFFMFSQHVQVRSGRYHEVTFNVTTLSNDILINSK